MVMDMGRTARGGLAHKIKAYGAQFWSACTTRQLEDILMMKEDVGLNRLVTLPPDYIRRVGTLSNSSHIQYNPTKTHDLGYYVDQTA